MDDQGRRSGFGWSEYGAVACLWCRNFFRQAHRERERGGGGGGLDPPKNYSCSNKSGRCDFFSQIYRCRKCKYDKCVEVGMKPSLVVAMAGEEEEVCQAAKAEATSSGASGGQYSDAEKRVFLLPELT